MPLELRSAEYKQSCLIEAPGMPGAHTMGLGELWREVKGFESLGVSIAEATGRGPGAGGTLESCEAVRTVTYLRFPIGVRPCDPISTMTT